MRAQDLPRAHASWREGISEVESLDTNCVCDAGYTRNDGLCDFCAWTCSACEKGKYSNGSISGQCMDCAYGSTEGPAATSPSDCRCEYKDPRFELDNVSQTCVCKAGYEQGPLTLLRNESTPKVFSELPFQDDQKCYSCQIGSAYSFEYGHCHCADLTQYPGNATVHVVDHDFVLGSSRNVRTYEPQSHFQFSTHGYPTSVDNYYPIAFLPGSSTTIIGGINNELYQKDVFDTATARTLLNYNFNRINAICVPPLSLWEGAENFKYVYVVDYVSSYSRVYQVDMRTTGTYTATEIRSDRRHYGMITSCLVAEDKSIWHLDKNGYLTHMRVTENMFPYNSQKYVRGSLVMNRETQKMYGFRSYEKWVEVLDYNSISDDLHDTSTSAYSLDSGIDSGYPNGGFYDGQAGYSNSKRGLWVTVLSPDNKYVYYATGTRIRRMQLDDGSYHLTTPAGQESLSRITVVYKRWTDGVGNEARFNIITSMDIAADGSFLVVMDNGKLRFVSLGKTIPTPASECLFCRHDTFLPSHEQYAFTNAQSKEACCKCFPGTEEKMIEDTSQAAPSEGEPCAAGTLHLQELVGWRIREIPPRVSGRGAGETQRFKALIMAIV